MNSIYKEDTTITRLSDSSSWERRRRRSVDVEFQERMPLMEVSAQAIIRPDSEGYLANPGDSLQNWKLRWFLLKDDFLFCFDNEKSYALGGILINGFQVRTADEELKEKYTIKLYRPDGPAHFFVAQSRDECNNWIKAFTRAAALNPDLVNFNQPGAVGNSTISKSPSRSPSSHSLSTGSTSRNGSMLNLNGSGNNGSASNGPSSSTADSFEAKTTRSLLLRNLDGNKITLRPKVGGSSLFNGSDRLVRVRPTETLCDLPSSEDNQNIVSRSAAMARLLAQPASYPRHSIRMMAIEMNSEKLTQFASQGRSSGLASFFKRSTSRASGLSMNVDHINSSPTSTATSPVQSPSGGRLSLSEIADELSAKRHAATARGTFVPEKFSSSAPSLSNMSNQSLQDSPTGSEAETQSTEDSGEFEPPPLARPGGSPNSSLSREGSSRSNRSQATRGSRMDISNLQAGSSITLRRQRPESTASPVSGWGGTGRRRSLVAGMEGSPLSPGNSAAAAAAAAVSAVAAAAAASAAFSAQKQLAHHDSFESEEGSSLAIDSASLDLPQYLDGFLERVVPRQNGSGEEDYIKLFFVLDDFYMRAYNDEDSVVCLLEIDLEGCYIEEEGEQLFVIRHGEHFLRVRAKDNVERQRWLSVINEMREYFMVDSDFNSENGGSMKRVGSDSGLLREDAEEAAEFSANLERLVSDLRKKSDQEGVSGIRSVLSNDDLLVRERVASALNMGVPPTRENLARRASDKPDQMASVATALKASNTASLSTEDVFGSSERSRTRKPMILFPKKEHVEGAFKPEGAHALTAEEMKDFAVNTGSNDDEGSGMNKMYRQNGEEVVLQFETGDDGKADKYMIAAGTIDQLVARLADENNPDTNYIDIFLLSYRHLLSSTSLIDRLIARFLVEPPPNATPEEEAYVNRWGPVIQIRTIGVVKKWVDNYYVDFATDESANAGLNDFLALVDHSGAAMIKLGERLRNIIKDKKEAIEAQRKLDEARKAMPARKSKVDFLQIEPREFARQLTLCDHSKFQGVHPVEYVIRLWEGNGDNTKNLTALIDWFNKVSFQVATLICVQPHVKKRAGIADNFIKVAKECLKMRNYNSTMAILSGLSNASVRRLKKTWALVPPKSLETMQQIETTMTSAFNYRTYREMMNEMDRMPRPPPVIPFMGLFLRDLTFLNDGNPKKFRGGLYNFGKLRMIAQRVQRLQAYQGVHYTFPTTRHTALVKEFLDALNPMTDENALYKCSLLCEPREDASNGNNQSVRLIEKWAKEGSSSTASGTMTRSSSPSKSKPTNTLQPMSIAAEPTSSTIRKSNKSSISA